MTTKTIHDTDSTKHKLISTDDMIKSNRIADYLNVSRDLIKASPLKQNSYLLYGKFDPDNSDDLGPLLQSIKRGEKYFIAPKVQSCHHAVTLSHDYERLCGFLSRMRPSFRFRNAIKRVFFYLVNIRLSELGIAPRWRGMKSPQAYPKGIDWPEGDALYARDLQVFDMEWRHRQYSSQRVSKGYGGMYTKLMEGESFDYAHAHIVASASIRAGEKSKALMLTDDMQSEMMVLKSVKINRQWRKLNDAVVEVEIDLNTAASRNRSRGDKLRTVIPNWLKIWKSAMMTPNASLSTMIDNYQKLTGERFHRSTFSSKIKALNKALTEVDSNHVIST